LFTANATKKNKGKDNYPQTRGTKLKIVINYTNGRLEFLSFFAEIRFIKEVFPFPIYWQYNLF
jgi:hypothetical protein